MVIPRNGNRVVPRDVDVLRCGPDLSYGFQASEEPFLYSFGDVFFGGNLFIRLEISRRVVHRVTDAVSNVVGGMGTASLSGGVGTTRVASSRQSSA